MGPVNCVSVRTVVVSTYTCRGASSCFTGLASLPTVQPCPAQPGSARLGSCQTSDIMYQRRHGRSLALASNSNSGSTFQIVGDRTSQPAIKPNATQACASISMRARATRYPGRCRFGFHATSISGRGSRVVEQQSSNSPGLYTSWPPSSSPAFQAAELGVRGWFVSKSSAR